MSRTVTKRLKLHYIWLILHSLVLPIHGVHAAETNLRIGGSGTDLATFRLIADEFKKSYPNIKVEIPASIGSGGAVKAVTSGWLNIGLMSRSLKQSEQSSKFATHLYAKTPLVFAVSNPHSISSITLKQIEAIFSGQLTKWNSQEEIRLILRPKSDSDTLILLAAYPQLAASLNKAHSQRGLPVAISDQDAINNLENLPGAFGTTTLATILSESRKVKVLALEDDMPSAGNVQYSLYKELYLILPKNVSQEAVKFIEFLRSSKSIEIFRRTGHQVIKFDPVF